MLRIVRIALGVWRMAHRNRGGGGVQPTHDNNRNRKVLTFPSGGAANATRARQARAECLRQHTIRIALIDAQWHIANAVASIADQHLTSVKTLQRLARLLTVSSKKPIKIDHLPVATVARALFLIDRAVRDRGSAMRFT